MCTLVCTFCGKKNKQWCWKWLRCWNPIYHRCNSKNNTARIKIFLFSILKINLKKGYLVVFSVNVLIVLWDFSFGKISHSTQPYILIWTVYPTYRNILAFLSLINSSSSSYTVIKANAKYDPRVLADNPIHLLMHSDEGRWDLHSNSVHVITCYYASCGIRFKMLVLNNAMTFASRSASHSGA